MVHPFYSGFCSLLQNELLWSLPHTLWWATPTFHPILNTPGPWLSACSPFNGQVFLMIILHHLFQELSRLNQWTEKRIKVGFWRGAWNKSLELQIQKDAWSWLGWRVHCSAWCFWLSHWLSMASENPVLPVLSRCCRSTGSSAPVLARRGTFLFCSPFSSRSHFFFGGGTTSCC